MNSAIYTGKIRHRRYHPKAHSFEYDVYMAYLDLAELDQVFSMSSLWSNRGFAPVRFKREDYFAPKSGVSIDQAVRQHVENQTGQRPAGAIRLLTNLRHLGYLTNPISCYYCFDNNDNLQTIVAEVNNTPWNERHAYVLPCRTDSKYQALNFTKDFHVSPFQEMNMLYHWRCNTPSSELQIHMSSKKQNTDIKSSETAILFDATLALNRVELTRSSIRSTLLRFPVMTLKVVAGIYWQAAILFFIKRTPFISHPKNLTKSQP